MAIPFARIRFVGRKQNGNACNSSAYNARAIIKEERTGKVYDYSKRGGLAYHEVLLPEHVDRKFMDIATLANEVENKEKKVNSQLYAEFLLPLDKDLDKSDPMTLEIYKSQIYDYIERKGWIQAGLGVQINIHAPHEGDMNWHCHGLVTTRAFAKCGTKLGEKARGIFGQILKGFVQNKEDIDNGIMWRDVQNDDYIARGMPNRVDLPGIIPQEHIGPVRMRSVLNEAVQRNEERRLLNIELLKSGKDVLERVSKGASVFGRADLERAVKIIPDRAKAAALVEEALASREVVALHHKNGEKSGLYTTKSVREEELKLARLSGYIGKQKNVLTDSSRNAAVKVRAVIEGKVRASDLSQQQGKALSHLLLAEGGVRVLKGRAGTGKSTVLGRLVQICRDNRIEVVGLAPTRKAVLELEAVGYKKCDTIKGFLFKLYNDRADLGSKSLIVIDEAGMMGNEDYAEVMRVAAAKNCNVILSGDERQLASVARGRMFEYFAERFGHVEMNKIRRQKAEWGKDVSRAFSEGRVREGLEVLKEQGRLCFAVNKVESMASLLEDWSKSSEGLNNRLIITVKNSDVDSLNEGARAILKSNGVLSGVETVITRTIGKDANGNKITKEQGFMAGDRVVFTEGNKELGVVNGNFGTLTECSAEKFTVRLDAVNETGKEIEFDPKKFNGVKHGYAVTIFKTQGASAMAVYVLHSGFSTLRNAYVAMSRHIKELRLYTDRESSKNFETLVRQLSYNTEKSNSIGYFTREDLQAGKILGATREMSAEEMSEERGLLARVYSKVKEQVGVFVDKYNINNKYYRFEKPQVSRAEVDEILELVHEYNESYKGGIVPGNDNNGGHGGEAERKKAAVGNYEVSKAVGAYYNKERESGGHSVNADGNINTVTNSNIAGIMHNGNMAAQNRTANMPAVQGLNAADVGEIREVGSPVGSVGAEERAGRSGGKDANNIASSMVNSIGNGSTGTNRKMTAKERFYANRDWHVRKQAAMKEAYNLDGERVRNAAKLHAERIALDLLGSPNSQLSKGNELRYGQKGSLAVRIGGNASGTWYDFSEGKGGDMFDLIQEVRGGDFREAIEYVRGKLGISSDVYLKTANMHETNDKYADRHKNGNRHKAQEEAKLRKSQGLYEKSKGVLESSVAFKYLKGRGISCNLSGDIKTTGVYVKELGKKLPALVAFARNGKGEITGGQQIVLDPATHKKANIAVQKKSFGKIGGSFVEVAGGESGAGRNGNNITIIAEGLETALSIKQAGVEGRILCSLGVSNIHNYVAKQDERIIIAADNDGTGSASEKVVEEARKHLSGNNMVVVVKPEKLGDFNDVLVSAGEKQIKEMFTPVTNKLESFSKAHVNIIVDYQKYNYRQSAIEDYLKDNKEALDSLRKFRPGYDIEKLRSQLEDFTDYTREKLLEHELKKEFKPYAIGKMNEFKDAKQQAKNIEGFLKAATKEREFCLDMYKNYAMEARDLRIGGYNELARQEETYRQQPKLIEDLRKAYNDAISLKAYNPELMMLDLQHKGRAINMVYGDIVFKCRNVAINMAKENLEEIREKGFILRDGIKFSNDRTYLEHIKHDKNIKIYVGDYATTKLAEINKSSLMQRLGQYKQAKQEQLAQEQLQKEPQKVKQLEMGRSL